MSDNDFRKELEDVYPFKNNRLSKQSLGFLGANRNRRVDLGIEGISLDFDSAVPHGGNGVGPTSHLTQPIASDKVPEDLQEKVESLVEAKPSDTKENPTLDTVADLGAPIDD